MSLQAEFAATLVDEWVRAGVRDAVICPGSRSTPLALAVLARRELSTHVRLDERSAGFFALGCSLASGRATVVVTTSGTAAAELHAAVVEADLAGVPLVVCTADRPPELQGVGAPQTIDQRQLYGTAVRHYAEPGVPEVRSRPSWRSFASRLVAEAEAGGRGPGPVHANLAFAEPLTGEAGALPPPRPSPPAGAPWHEVRRPSSVGRQEVDALLERLGGIERGVVVAGAGAGGSAAGGPEGRAGVLALAGALGWPVLADARAWPRTPTAGVVSAADSLLRSPKAAELLRPDAVLRLGAPHASKVLAQWLAGASAGGAVDVLVDRWGRFQDPDRTAAALVVADPGELAAAAARRIGTGPGAAGAGRWRASWEAAEQAAQAAIAGELAGEQAFSEPGLARALFAALPPGSTLVASSSMPVRDVEWYAAPRAGAPRVLANRGANGIDGVTSTVLGVAAGLASPARPGPAGPAPRRERGPVVGLLGDLAFLHDLSALVWGRRERRPEAVLVVVDNGGGGIFDLLPQAGSLDPTTYERGFTTPQDCELDRVAAAFGCQVVPVERPQALPGALDAALGAGGIGVVLVRVERTESLALRRRLEEAVVGAVTAALPAAGGGRR